MTTFDDVPNFDLVPNLDKVGEENMAYVRTLIGGDQLRDASINVSKIDSTNGVSELVQLNGSGQYPALDGSLITGITAGQVGLTDVFVFKGLIACAGKPNYPIAAVGDVYKVSTAGKIGGPTNGVNVESGDTIYCIATNASAGDHTTVGMNFSILQNNLDGVVIGPASAVDDNIATFDSTTGKLIQDGGTKISDLVATTVTVNGHALSSNVTVTASDVGLGTLARQIFAPTAAQTVFILAHTPITNSDDVYLNGQLLTPGALEDYVLGSDSDSNEILTINWGLKVVDKLVVKYMY